MNKLIEKDDCGNWSLKGVRWSNLMPGALITKDTYEKVYAALCKLMDYEDTGLSPKEVQGIEDLKNQASKKPVTHEGTNRADCPACGAVVRGIDKPFGDFCSKCGQRLDWSE